MVDTQIIDRIEGNLVYLVGHPYPIKGLPHEHTVHVIGIIKKLLLSWPLISLKRITTLGIFALEPYFIPEEEMMAASRELRDMMPSNLGLLISHVIELDNAYRFRFQHMCDAVTQIELATKPHASLKRMLNLNRQNDYQTVHNKIKKLVWLLRILLLWPPFFKQWKKAILSCTFKNLQTDEGDRYWISIRTDYSKGNLNPIR